MTEIEHLGKRIDTVKAGNLDKSELVRTVYDVARSTGGKFVDYDERLRFIALAKILKISTDEKIKPALMQTYVEGAITKPHWGNNIDVGLLEFVDGMQELNVDNSRIADYIAETLEYRVVEGIALGGCLECVAIPFVKGEPAKSKVKDKLHKLQKEPTSIKSNPNSRYKTNWDQGTARDIEDLYKDHEQSLYELARINIKIDNDFDSAKVRDWNNKAKVKMVIERVFKEEIHPELLSEEGQEGNYRQLLTKQQRLLKEIPYSEGRDSAIELAWLDIVLDSENTGGARGKGAMNSSALYTYMLKVAEALKSPEHEILNIKRTAKERYKVDLK